MASSFMISLIVVFSAYFWWTFNPSKRPNLARLLPPGTIPRFIKQDDSPSTASKSAKKKKQKKKANKGAEASSGAEKASLQNANSKEVSPSPYEESHSDPTSPNPGIAKQQTPSGSGKKEKQKSAKSALAVSYARVAAGVQAPPTPVSPDSTSESRSDRAGVRVPDLDADDDENPQYARVLKVNKTGDDLSASEVELDDGWRMIDVHSKPMTLRISGGPTSSVSKPAPSAASKQQDGLTKKQRENQRKAEKKKAAKAAMDSETEARLRDHRRAQMQATINEAVKADKAKAIQRQLMKNYEPAHQARQAPSAGSGGWYAADDDTPDSIWD
ncbi:hypothetical protein BJ742DRAFT_851534 [Cladochytrium replicatum]|nr:hypothetical protein BJ742DRAFT_851534 [Cladochytrium replicatum]